MTVTLGWYSGLVQKPSPEHQVFCEWFPLLTFWLTILHRYWLESLLPPESYLSWPVDYSLRNKLSKSTIGSHQIPSTSWAPGWYFEIVLHVKSIDPNWILVVVGGSSAPILWLMGWRPDPQYSVQKRSVGGSDGLIKTHRLIYWWFLVKWTLESGEPRSGAWLELLIIIVLLKAVSCLSLFLVSPCFLAAMK